MPYDLWTRQDFIEATSGNVVDYGAIEQRILADAALFQVREIAYDPWNATHIALRLQDEGATMVEFRQGFRSMAAPTRELEKLIVSQKLAHGGNPVTRWMAAHAAVAQDPAATSSPPRTSPPSASMASSPRSWPSAAPWSPRKSPSPSTPCSSSDRSTADSAAVATCADQGQAHLMTVFQSALDATFAAFGIEAVYTPAGGDPVPVRVIARRPDTIVGFGETRIHTETATFELRASEVANPRPGDQLTVGGQTFVIQGEPERRDPDKLAWSLDARPM